MQRLLLVVGSLIVGVSAYATLARGYPSILSPLSVPVTIVAMFALDSFPGSGSGRNTVVIAGVCSVIAMLFIVWSAPAFRANAPIPRRSLFLFTTLVVLCLLWFVIGWGNGVKHQGLPHVRALLIVNCISMTMIASLWGISRTHLSVYTCPAFHILLFSWFAWLAFPWLGELP